VIAGYPMVCWHPRYACFGVLEARLTTCLADYTSLRAYAESARIT